MTVECAGCKSHRQAPPLSNLPQTRLSLSSLDLADDAPTVFFPMPSRLRSALSKSLSRPLDTGSAYRCPSCAPRRRTLTTRTGINANVDKFNRARQGSRQNARLLESTSAEKPRSFTTSPAINPGKTVPPRFKELYDSLSGVNDAAIEQVSISRLQLALRGLESEEPLIRIAGELRMGSHEGHAVQCLCRNG